jgi:hypothetical protein
VVKVSKKAFENAYCNDLLLLDIRNLFMFSSGAFDSEIDSAWELSANLFIPKGYFFWLENSFFNVFFSALWKEYISRPPGNRFLLGREN